MKRSYSRKKKQNVVEVGNVVQKQPTFLFSSLQPVSTFGNLVLETTNK